MKPTRPEPMSGPVAVSMLHACPVCGVSVALVRRGPILVTVAHAGPSGAKCKGGAVRSR